MRLLARSSRTSPHGTTAPEMRHRKSVAGGWWLCASTPDGTARVGIRHGDVEFEVLDDGRLAFGVALVMSNDRSRVVHGIAAATASRSGLYRWTGRGFIRLATWFRWNYRLIAGGELLVVGHPGSIATQPNILVFGREHLTERMARELLDRTAAELGLSPVELLDLARYAPSREPRGSLTARL